MRRLSVEIGLVLFCGLVMSSEVVTASEAATLAPGVPLWEQAPWPFARVPIAGAPCGIVIPLGEKTSLAFDSRTMRTHLAVSGELQLAGYPFKSRHGGPFSSFTGSTLWTLPAQLPWSGVDAAGELSARFRGISTKGGVTLLYDIIGPDGNSVRVHEMPRLDSARETKAIVRRLEIAPAEKTLRWLVHVEKDKASAVGTNHHAVVFKRSKDCLLAVLRGSGVSFSLESNSEGATLLWLSIPRHQAPVAIEVASAVVADEGIASTLMIALTNGAPAPPRMEFLESHAPDPEAGAPRLISGPTQPGRVENDEFFRREQLPIPPELDLLVSGMDWLPGGDLAISTWPGEVYVASAATNAVTNLFWRRFAGGLQEALGLKMVRGEMYVAQKCELTRLRDTDGNGEADLFECVNDGWGFSGDMHSFAYGPALDAEGNFYVTLDGNTGSWKPRWDVPYRGWIVKISPDGGQLEGFSSGLRSPNGCFEFGPQKDIFCTDNEGHWIGTCKLNHCRAGKFFGYPSSTPMPREVFQKAKDFDAPAVWFPRRLSKSASGGAAIPKGWPFAGQLLVGDFGNASIMRVALERVNGEWQGAVWPFKQGFLSGVTRLTFGPDGKLYVGGLKRGWNSSGPQEFALERMEFMGRTPFAVREVHARTNGFELFFTEPVETATVATADNWLVKQFNYKFHPAYGSPEFDHAGKPNSATTITVSGVTVAEDKRRVVLELSGWKPGYVTQVLNKAARSAAGPRLWHDTFYYTLNQIPR